MNVQKKYYFMITLFLAGCASSGEQQLAGQKNSANGLSRSINSCVLHHQQRNSYIFGSDLFSIVDAAGLSYYIMIGGEIKSTKERLKYCHIDKNSLALIYGNNASYNIDPSDAGFNERYGDIASGKVALGKIKLLRYKLIAQQWRYIETRELPSL